MLNAFAVTGSYSPPAGAQLWKHWVAADFFVVRLRADDVVVEAYRLSMAKSHARQVVATSPRYG